MGKHIVIVGAGQAAASFIARFRQIDQSSNITLVGEEASLPYQRPPLSKKYATGDMTKDQLLLRAPDWYEQNGVTLITGVRVDTINAEAKTITLANGDILPWDKLVLTTGASPRKLPAEMGGELNRVHALRNLEDADAIGKLLETSKRVAIIGGGYIGLEAAAVCRNKGLDVMLIEAVDRILQRVACSTTANWFNELHTSHGVDIRQNASLKTIEGKEGCANAVVLEDGSRIEVDFVLVGIGIIPNTKLAEMAGLNVEGGIVVDEYCQTSHADIYAAGDCTIFSYRGQQTRLESVQNAIDQAECAADNLAGNPRSYEPHPWFWSDQYDVKLQIAGLNRGFDEVVMRPGEREGGVSHFYYSNNAFIAVDSMNDGRTYMVCKKLLERGEGVSKEQAQDRNLELKSLL